MNDSVSGVASYPASGSGTASVSASVIEISYDQPTGNYIVLTSAAGQTFRAADRDAALSSAEADVFIRSFGDTTDSLYLTTNSEDPGTRRSPKYRYVGGGVWQRTVTTPSGIDGTIDAFAYGIETPDIAVPKVGSAAYDVRLVGVAAFGNATIGARGSGTLQIDFGSGDIAGYGQIVSDKQKNWQVIASLSSDSNGFSGAFGMDDFDVMNGSIVGRLYGPSGEELGAAWHWTNDFLGTAYAGFMLGKDSDLFPTNPSLRSLIVDEDFADEGFVYRTRFDSNTGVNFYNLQTSPDPGTGSEPDVYFSEVSKTIVIKNGFQLDHQPLLPGNRNPSLSDSTFDVYEFSEIALNGHPADYTIRIFRPSNTNPIIALTYTSFANWHYINLDHEPSYRVYEGWVAFGQETPQHGIPTSGTGNYAAAIFGQSGLAQATDGTLRSYLISGNASFTFDFGGGAMGGWLSPLLFDPKTSQSYSLGQYDFDQTFFPVGSQTFSASFTVADEYPYISHYINGQFTGPGAEELFARWQTATTDPLTLEPLSIFGVAVGARD